ncbi:MAG: arginine--tRNA ligase [Aigarchaeota archaeon]|nr:arginine--tRNA ligase [Aigarchaeota archaeon]MDW8092734.1 arginine--tRNA ligase [Nitrososphaerota archaeon]
MSVKRLIHEAKELMERVGVRDPRIEISKDPAFGEVTSTSPFELARKTSRKPIEIAEDVAGKIREITKAGDLIIADAMAAKPGFINFTVNWLKYARVILDEIREEGERYGLSDHGRGATVLIEHTSVNPNKPLHLGHGRNVIIGDTLYRLFRAMGYRTVVVNYIDDSGNQMADIHVAFKRLGYKVDPPSGERYDEYCGRVYAEVSRAIEESQDLLSLKRRILGELEDPTSASSELNKLITDRVLSFQMRTCWRLGARYDILNRESDIVSFKLWDETFTMLVRSGAVYKATEGKDAGCWMINLRDHPVLSKEDDEVLIRSDGTLTYVARDVAYAAWKTGLLEKDFTYRVWGKNPDGTEILETDLRGEVRFDRGRPEIVMTVVDVRQRRPQEVVRHALSKLTGTSSGYVHFGYEVVALSIEDARKLGFNEGEGEFVHMSGRAGLYLTVDAVLDLLKSKALQEASRRHSDWDNDKLEEVAEKIAVAALRYSMLKQDTDKMIVFDSSEASRLVGDTGPYLQYTYARACRILEKSPVRERGERVGVPELVKQERDLLRVVSYAPAVFEEVLNLMLLKRLTTYAHSLCAAFNEFYEYCPVLTAEAEVRDFRLELTKAFTQVLSNVASVMGITLLNEM